MPERTYVHFSNDDKNGEEDCKDDQAKGNMKILVKWDKMIVSF